MPSPVKRAAAKRPLECGENVIASLDTNKYHIFDVVITKAGEWLLHGRSRLPHEILQNVDVAFNALHGSYGEDGTVQRVLERHGVPYTGSNAYSSMVAMHKAIAKDHLRHENILLPRHFLVTKEMLAKADAVARSVTSLFGPRYIVKPSASGSSVGILRATGEAELHRALHTSLQSYESVLVEEYIEGREATCAVIESFRGAALYALPPVEIITASNAPFFNYEAKYSGTSTELCPSTFSFEIKKEIERIALHVHTTLQLSHYSRSDFIVSPNGVFFLEVNTLPGLTAHSLLPKSLAAAGIPFAQFIDHLLTQATQKIKVVMR